MAVIGASQLLVVGGSLGVLSQLVGRIRRLLDLVGAFGCSFGVAAQVIAARGLFRFLVAHVFRNTPRFSVSPAERRADRLAYSRSNSARPPSSATSTRPPMGLAVLNVSDRTIAYRIGRIEDLLGRSVFARSGELAAAIRVHRVLNP